jgi:hypothetical protein
MQRPPQSLSVDESADDFVHVAHAFATDEIDANVEEMRSIAQFIAPHAYQAVPVILLEKPFELPAAVGVGALGDNEVAVVLPEVDGSHQAAYLRLGTGMPRCPRGISGNLDDCLQMLRRGAAAPADDVHAELADEPAHAAGVIVRLHRKMRFPVHKYRQAGVGERADEFRIIRRDKPNAFA